MHEIEFNHGNIFCNKIKSTHTKKTNQSHKNRQKYTLHKTHIIHKIHAYPTKRNDHNIRLFMEKFRRKI